VVLGSNFECLVWGQYNWYWISDIDKCFVVEHSWEEDVGRCFEVVRSWWDDIGVGIGIGMVGIVVGMVDIGIGLVDIAVGGIVGILHIRRCLLRLLSSLDFS